MSQIHYIPEGFPAVIPYFVVPDGQAFASFLRRVFDAQEGFVSKTPEGAIMHAEMRISGAVIEFGQANSQAPAMRLNTHVYVPDTDTAYQRALDAGAKSVRVPKDEFYGDRTAGVEDPAGNIWWIATRVEKVSPEELARRAATQATH
ncbi:MAG: VOC family protein [Bryobacteraceae bacterium]|jgi:PhnB protein